MPRLVYDGTPYERTEGESVLDALLRAGVEVPHSCKAGACGSCLMRGTSPATVPKSAQQGLKDAWVAEGYFLACVCRPEGEMAAAPVGRELRVPATIRAVEYLSESVLRVRLALAAAFEYRAGQHITLLREDGLARTYSLASLPHDDALELHVRVFPDGRMSQWLATRATPGTPIAIQGPSGDCFYLEGRPDQPLLLVGTGTGLAPLVGIARDALLRGHRGPIRLVHGARNSAGLYLGDELAAMRAGHPAFDVWQTTLEADGPIDRAIAARMPSLAGFRAFLCGDPAIVQSLRKRIFLAGGALNDIHADGFLPSAS